MKAHVYVTYKTTVLDPQGQTIARALNSMGHPEIVAVRQGKFFAIELADDTRARPPWPISTSWPVTCCPTR